MDASLPASTPGVEAAPGTVTAIVVDADAGPWFETTLQALADQTYTGLRVLVVDAVSAADQAARITRIVPTAYVRRLRAREPYAVTVNRAAKVAAGSKFLLITHDDVAPAPDAVHALVARAEATGAAAVTPKYQDWDDPDLITGLTGTVDFTAAFLGIDRGERDQGQHDDATTSMAALGGMVLIDTATFFRLGGLDPAIGRQGEMLDYTLRLRAAGETLTVAPHAHVRHREASERGERPVAADEEDFGEADPRVLARRHRVRIALKLDTGPRWMLALVAQFLVLVGELVYGLATGKRSLTTAAVAAFTWNIAHWRSLLQQRRALDAERRRSGAELRQDYGSFRRRISTGARQDWEQWRSDVAAHDFAGDVTRFTRLLRRLPVLGTLGLVLVGLIGSRDLLTGPLPVFGQVVPLEGPIDAFRRYFAWWPGPFGVTNPVSPAHLLLGGWQTLFLGASGVAQRVLLLATIPLGVWGMRGLVRPLRSVVSRWFAIVAYASMPLAYGAIGSDRFDVLVTYAVVPFVLTRVLRLEGNEPYPGRRGTLRLRPVVHGDDFAALDEDHQVEGADARGQEGGSRYSFLVVRRLLPLALIVAAAGAFAPQLPSIVLVLTVSLLLGAVVAGERPERPTLLRLLVVVGGAVLVALFLLSPAYAGSATGWSALWRVTAVESGPNIVLFAAGTTVSWASTTWLAVGIVPLVAGRSWRQALAIKLWSVILVSVTLAALSVRFGAGVGLDPALLGVLAAVAASANVAVAVVVVQSDLRDAQQWYRGLRVALAGLVVIGFVPVLQRATDGGWGLSGDALPSALSWMRPVPDGTATGAFRTLWIGRPGTVPGGDRGVDGLALAVAENAPTPTGMAPPTRSDTADRLIHEGLAAVRQQRTVLVGEALGPLGVQYLVIPLRTGLSETDAALDPPDDLLAGLDAQLDLRKVRTDDALAVYENTAFRPVVPYGSAGDGRAQGVGSAVIRYVPPLWLRAVQVANATAWIVLFVIAVRYLPRRKQFA